MHMNTGPCNSIGRQEPAGFALLSLYSFIISRCMASFEAGSFLPLYLFWIFIILGCIACMARMPFMLL